MALASLTVAPNHVWRRRCGPRVMSCTIRSSSTTRLYIHLYIAPRMCGYAVALRADLRSQTNVWKGAQASLSATVSVLWCPRGCCSKCDHARAIEPDRPTPCVRVCMHRQVHICTNAWCAVRMHDCAVAHTRVMLLCTPRISQLRAT